MTSEHTPSAPWSAPEPPHPTTDGAVDGFPPPSERGLLIVADDLGLSEAVDEGILACLAAGTVAATSAMLCLPDGQPRLARAVVDPRARGRIGLHLQLTAGVPRSDPARIPSLVGADGRFPASWREISQRLDPEEIALEWRAQYDALRACGVEPAHVDTHHNVHLHPAVLPVYVRLAATWNAGAAHGFRARGGGRAAAAMLRKAGVATTDSVLIQWGREPVTRAALLELLARAFGSARSPRTVELITHPGGVDQALHARSKQVEARALERDLFLDPETAAAIRARGITLLADGTPLLCAKRPRPTERDAAAGTAAGAAAARTGGSLS